MHVLGLRGGAEIGAAVIESFSISMVDDEAWRGRHDEAVEAEDFDFVIFVFGASDGVVFLAISAERPFIPGVSVIISGIEDSPFAFAELDSS